ncbi:MAG TPA: hypothetical protein VKY57_07230 [Chitinispirillaceae bacterium]|jgi:hypothetical protein|nr:hypothetical protein [Chitinispirillaceae bacterium]
MKINIYFLIVGILSILFSITHAWNGQSAILPLIEATGVESTIKTTIFYVWHIISVENLVFGIAFLGMAFSKNQSRVKFAAWTIMSLIAARWLVLFISTLLRDITGIENLMVDSIAIIIYIGLILLGIRKGNT